MIIQSYSDLQRLVADYLQEDAFCFDVETRGEHRLDPKRNDVFWLSLATRSRADVIPMGHPHGRLITPERVIHEPIPGALTPTGKPSRKKVKQVIPAKFSKPPAQLDTETVFGELKKLFFSDKLKVGHNLKFDLPSVGKYLGEIPPPPYADTQIMAFLINENIKQQHNLEALVRANFGFEYAQLGKAGVDTFSFSEAALYSVLDAKYCWLLYRKFMRLLQQEKLLKAFNLEMDVLEVVIAMEQEGATMDVPLMEELYVKLKTRLAEIQAELDEHNGGPINLNADRQVANLVYNIRGFKPRVFTDKTEEPSVASKALAPYKKDKVVALILEHAELHKVFSTYIENNLPLVKENGGKLYAEFDQTGARTGRFSSRSARSGRGGMNLQNVPTRKGKEVRDLFIAPPGYKLVVADYSQIELRILAAKTEDPLLMKAYQEGLDLHTMTAQAAFKVKEPTERQRSLAKNVNFTVVFGGGPGTIADRYEVPLKEARTVFNAFWATYKRVKPWMDRQLSEAKSRHRPKGPGQPYVPPYVRTVIGRKRRLPELRFPDDKLRSTAERQAINTIIQGSAADVAKMAMVQMHEEFRGTDTKLIMVVHDEFVVVTPSKEAKSTVALVKDCMERVNPFKVPLEADVKLADRWSEK